MTNASIGTADKVFREKEQDAWNIADGFTKIKILRQLINLDRYENLAMFGKQELEDMPDPSDIPYKRVEGMERLIFELKQVIGNCKFSIEKNDMKTLDSLIKRIENVEIVINGIATLKRDFVKNEDILEINEEHFKLCFQIIRCVKDELNVLMNRAGLIFKLNDVQDIDEILNDIAEGG